MGKLISVEMTFVTSDVARRGAGPLSVRSGGQRRRASSVGWPATGSTRCFYVTGRAVVGVTARTGVFGARADASRRWRRGDLRSRRRRHRDVPRRLLASRGGPAKAAGRFAAASGGCTGTPTAKEPTACSKSTARSRSGTRWKMSFTTPEDKTPGYGGDAGFLLVQDWLDCIRTGRRDNRNPRARMLATLELIDAILPKQPRRPADRMSDWACAERGREPRNTRIRRSSLSGINACRGFVLSGLLPFVYFVSFVVHSRLLLCAHLPSPCRRCSSQFFTPTIGRSFAGRAAGSRGAGSSRCRRRSGRSKHVLWKTELPPGHSSPAIVGDKIFLTAVRDKEHLETICLDRADGQDPVARGSPAQDAGANPRHRQLCPAEPRGRRRAGRRAVRLQRPVLLRPRRPRAVASRHGAVQRRIRGGGLADHRRTTA